MSLKLSENMKPFDTVEVAPSMDAYTAQKHAQRRSIPSFTNNENTTPASKGGMGLYSANTVRVNMSDALNDGHGFGIPESNNTTTTSLHDNDDNSSTSSEVHDTPQSAKFGTFDGVLGRCLLCMWGVIMFLRTGWIVGNAGVWQSTLVMLLSASITMFTTLSLSAICTNGEISHGGPYFLISRSLGPQFGGVIGILFAIGNCVGVALHLVGFSEAVTSLYDDSWANGWDIVIIAEIGLIFLMIIAYKGVGYIIKFNLVLLALMLISILVFFIGTFFSTEAKVKLGFTGYSSKTFNANWNSQYMPGYDFLTMVAIFFPSVTGCMAGANISGDLKKPSVNIPVGTTYAVIISMCVYVMIAWQLGACVIREVCEDGAEINEEFMTCVDRKTVISGTGLYHDYVIMSDISLFRPLVDMGIFASTFSSATSCFVAAPRIFKAVCDDKLIPIFDFFGVGRKSDDEPMRAYALVMCICGVIMLSGDINFIAPMVTNFFLITYALVNYSVFAWDISKSPGWRPSFKYYNPYLSLFATLQSVVLMFLIDWLMALLTVIVGAILYKYIDSQNIVKNWGTTVESSMYLKACNTALKYQNVASDHAKITRPSFLIMSTVDNASEVVELFNVSSALNYGRGLIVIGHIMIGDVYDPEMNEKYLQKRKFKMYDLPSDICEKCIMECHIAKSYEEGSSNMLQLAGMGGMKPNVVCIKMSKTSDLNENESAPLWFSTMTCALLTGCGVLMIPAEFNLEMENDKSNITGDVVDDAIDLPNYIDIWWLFDDGGLTILAAYLLTKNKKYKHCKLRIMVLDEIGFEDQTEMVSLMDKLRIDAEIVSVKSVRDSANDSGLLGSDSSNGFANSTAALLDNEQQKPMTMATVPSVSQVSLVEMTTPVGGVGGVGGGGDASTEEVKDEENIGNTTPVPDANASSKSDFLSNVGRRTVSDFASGKIVKYRRVGRTIEKNSVNSRLCLLTMPFPRKKFEWWEYTQIIHDLTPKDIPTIFIRGTQDQVLTFVF